MWRIPGVGPRAAEVVTAYSEDLGRLAGNRTVGRCFSLAPWQDQSAGRDRLEHITRQGPATVQMLLTEVCS